jgi:hypothetical protein
MRVVPAVMCVCGERTVAARVSVEWADGPRLYWYCHECADDITFAIEGATEVSP